MAPTYSPRVKALIQLKIGITMMILVEAMAGFAPESNISDAKNLLDFTAMWF